MALPKKYHRKPNFGYYQQKLYRHGKFSKELDELSVSQIRQGLGDSPINVAIYLNEDVLDAYYSWDGGRDTWVAANNAYMEDRAATIRRALDRLSESLTQDGQIPDVGFELFNEIPIVLAHLTPNQLQFLKNSELVSAIRRVEDMKTTREALVKSSELAPPPSALAKMATAICEYEVVYLCGFESDGTRRFCVDVKTNKACEDAIAAVKARREQELRDRNLASVDAARKRLTSSDARTKSLLTKKFTIAVSYPGRPEQTFPKVDPTDVISMEDAYIKLLEAQVLWASAPFGAGVMAEQLLMKGVIRNATLLEEGFFKGTYYGKLVLERMAEDPFHRFPELVKNWQNFGTVRDVIGGDRLPYKLLKIPGSYQGKSGVFEFMKDANGEITHRLFRPTKG
jgi:hypothetical protein